MKTIVKDYKNFFKDMHRNVALYLGILFFATLLSAAYNVLFGIYMKNLGYTEAFVGQILSLKTFGIALGAVPVSIFAQKYDKKRTLIVGIAIMIVSSFVILNVRLTALMQLFAVVHGIGHATVMILQAPIIYDYTADEHRVTAFSMAFVFQNIAFVVGSFVLGHLSQALSALSGPALGNYYVLSGATVLAFVGILIALLIESKPMEAPSNSGIVDSFLDVFKGYKTILKGRSLKYLAQVALVGLGAGMIVPFFSLYLKYSLMVSDGTVGTIMAISQVGTVIGGLIVPPLAKRIGRVQTVILCQLLSIPFLISISLPQGIVIITISFFFRSSLMNMASPIIRSLAMEIVDDETRTYMSGMISLTNNLFRSLGIFIGGIVMYRFSYNTPYYWTILCYLLGTWIIYQVFYKQRETA